MVKPEHDSSAKLRVLVADDDPFARQLVVKKLDGLGCEFVEAQDGLVAWHAAMSNSFDLTIVDLGMPNLDGLDLIRCVRSHPRTKHMPLVVITTRDDKQAITDSLNAGATSFLTKPISWTTFTPHIAHLLKLSHEANAARREVARLKATCRVKYAILGNVIGETFANACDILEEVGEILTQTEEGAKDGATSQALERISLHTKEVQSLVTKASDVARSVTETVAVDDAIVFASDVIGELAAIVETTAAACDVSLKFPRNASRYAMRCDRAALTEALAQLTLNAIAYSPSNSAVNVRCDLLPDGALVFEVSDDGQGMTPVYLAKVLAPLAFKEAVPALGRGDFGLGLSLAKAIAEAHGGASGLRSMPGQGTTATLFLPADRVITASGASAA